jgi:hypothetical protein
MPLSLSSVDRRIPEALSTDGSYWPMLLKNDFEGDLRVILIQGERPTSKIDSKVRLL